MSIKNVFSYQGQYPGPYPSLTRNDSEGVLFSDVEMESLGVPSLARSNSALSTGSAAGSEGWLDRFDVNVEVLLSLFLLIHLTCIHLTLL